MTEYHYVITLQWNGPCGIASNTQSGVLQVPQGTTRREVFDFLLPAAREGAGVPEQGSVVVLFCSLEPNQPGGESR